MKILNSFTPANDYNFGAQWPNGRRVFLLANKTLEGICVAWRKRSKKKISALFRP